MAVWLNAPYMMTATDLTGLIALTGFAELHKNRLLVYQEPVLIAISGFGTQELLAVLPSKSDAKTTQGQSCSSND